MEVFGLTRLLFILISNCYPPKGSSALFRFFCWFHTIAIGSAHILGFWTGVRYGLHAFGLKDYEGSLNSISQLGACLTAAYTTFAGLYFRGHITRTLDHYVELHEKGNIRCN